MKGFVPIIGAIVLRERSSTTFTISLDKFKNVFMCSSELECREWVQLIRELQSNSKDSDSDLQKSIRRFAKSFVS